MKLPHTKNSKAGANMYELVVASQFAFYLFPPAGVPGDAILLNEHIRKVEGFFEDKIGSSTVTQKFQTATRTYDSNEKETTYEFTMDLTLNLDDANVNYVRKQLQAWGRLKYNPMTSERGLKKNYVGSAVGELYRRDGAIYHRRTASQVFITDNIPDLPMDYDSHEPEQLSIKFVADWMDEQQN